jgi:PAT family beta-lactamase induction signal transducer AmpG
VRTLTESRLWRLIVLGALYVAQGVPWGFTTVAYIVFLADQGLAKSAIGGIVYWAYLPWGFKIFAAPLIDRFPTRRFGRRRHFIIAAELLMGATLLTLPFIDPRTNLAGISAALFIHNSFAAIQDVATDGLAVDVLPENERGKANAIMWAAKAGGSAVGGSLGIFLAKHVGWTTLFVAFAVLVWAIMLLVVFVRERPIAEEARASRERLNLRELRRSFSFPTPLVGILIAIVGPAGFGLLGTVYMVTLRQDLKFTENALSIITGVDLPVSIGGSLLGGFLADRFGAKKTMAAGMLIMGMTFALFAALPSLWPRLEFQVAWMITSSLGQYMYTAAGLSFFMSISNPAIGATQFAAYMAPTNFTYAYTAEWGGRLGDKLGVAPTFAIAAVVQIAAIVLLPLCNARRAEERFRKQASSVENVPAPAPV